MCFWFCALPKCRALPPLPNPSPAQKASPCFCYPDFQSILTNPCFGSLRDSKATLWPVSTDLFQLHLWFFICSLCPGGFYLISFSLFRIIQCKAGKENVGLIWSEPVRAHLWLSTLPCQSSTKLCFASCTQQVYNALRSISTWTSNSLNLGGTERYLCLLCFSIYLKFFSHFPKK